MNNAKLFKIWVLSVLLALPMACYGADCQKALFGWTPADGTPVAGTLAVEGVSKKNPLGKQNLKGDRGNFDKHGKNCGELAAALRRSDGRSQSSITATQHNHCREAVRKEML